MGAGTGLRTYTYIPIYVCIYKHMHTCIYKYMFLAYKSVWIFRLWVPCAFGCQKASDSPETGFTDFSGNVDAGN